MASSDELDPVTDQQRNHHRASTFPLSVSSPPLPPSLSTSELPSSSTQPSETMSAIETGSTSPPPSSTHPQRSNTISDASPAGTSLGMTASSTALGAVNAARRPGGGSNIQQQPSALLASRGSGLTQGIQAKMRDFHLQRQSTAGSGRQDSTGLSSLPTNGQAVQPRGSLVAGPGGIPPNLNLPTTARPSPSGFQSAPAVPITGASKGLSLAQKRGMALPGGLPGSPVSAGRTKPKPGLSLSQMNATAPKEGENKDEPNQSAGIKRMDTGGSMMDKYAEYIDAQTGSLKFKGKAVIHGRGVDFQSGSSFSISLDEVDTLNELGKGNYGTVYKVRHSRPRVRRPGRGLAGNMANSLLSPSPTRSNKVNEDRSNEIANLSAAAGTSGVVMAMKEIRLELDDAKFAAIIMELDILHRCVSPYIVEFYGAFFQEGAVYICMEFMDGGSVDKLYGDGIPESVLRKITLATTIGLKTLKEDHNIIHRDVKPTNILVNTRGQVKICDFGVSGNLVASIARTNIGCQSYMAPERISSGGVAQAGASGGGGSYGVQSDIWSLGLTIIECALGRYPYPPETYNNIFSQLSAIVEGSPPDLPVEDFSEAARDFVAGCLNKIPKLRPTYAMLLQHAWLAPLQKPAMILEEDEDVTSPVEPTSGKSGVEGTNDGDKKNNNDNEGKTSTPAAAPSSMTQVVDEEVAAWVLKALDRRRQSRSVKDYGGTSGAADAAGASTTGCGGGSAKAPAPALHAAPLDAVSPELERKDIL